MYCAKCGAQISEADQYCPKCGKENINYVKPAAKRAARVFDSKKQPIKEPEKNAGEVNNDSTEQTISNKARKKSLALPAGCIAAVLAVVLFFAIGRGKPSTADNSRISYPQNELQAFVGAEDGTVYFVHGTEVRSFDGKAVQGKATPDRSKFLVRYEDGKLNMYGDPETEPVLVSDDVEALLYATDRGCFFSGKGNKGLYYYDFESKECINTGVGTSDYMFSSSKTSVIGVEKEMVRSFTIGETSAKELFNEETADNAENICCIADDGSNLIWATKEGNIFNVYMMKNNVPERIGKIKNAEEYSYIFGQFYNDDKSFVVYSNGSAQMIFGNNGEIKELTLPCVKRAGGFCNTKGEYLRSDQDFIEEPYFMTAKTNSAKNGTMYRLLKDGTVKPEVDGINLESSWSGTSAYYIRAGIIYYLDQNNDLRNKKLGEENESVLMTTDVRAFVIPENGKYAYIIKSGGLYAMDLSEGSFSLNPIWNSIGEEDTFYVTDRDDTIYFITGVTEIKDSYRTKGKLYKYTIGGEAEQIAGNVLGLITNGQKNYSADHPIIKQYVSNEKYDYVVNIGTCVEGEYKELVSKVKD